MTRTLLSFAPALLVLAVAITGPGCAMIDFHHGPQASVLFEQKASADVFISEVHSYEDGGGLVLYGKVKRTAANCCDTARGHLDAAVVGPDGSVLDAVSFLYSPRNIPKVRTRSARFAARLPYTVPAGTTIRLAHHKDHDVVELGGNTFACRRSAALADIEG